MRLANVVMHVARCGDGKCNQVLITQEFKSSESLVEPFRTLLHCRQTLVDSMDPANACVDAEVAAAGVLSAVHTCIHSRSNAETLPLMQGGHIAKDCPNASSEKVASASKVRDRIIF